MSPRFLTLQQVLRLQELSAEEFGGGTGLRDRGALESAAAQPAATYGGDYLHRDLFEMAAAYAFHIAQSQAFVDGNKRTGLLSALMFLAINGVEIADPEEKLHHAMIAVAERRLDKPGLAALLRKLSPKSG